MLHKTSLRFDAIEGHAFSIITFCAWQEGVKFQNEEFASISGRSCITFLHNIHMHIPVYEVP
jgi:hypothetical protein